MWLLWLKRVIQIVIWIATFYIWLHYYFWGYLFMCIKILRKIKVIIFLNNYKIWMVTNDLFFIFLINCHWHVPSNVHWKTWQACCIKCITFYYITLGLCKLWIIWFFKVEFVGNMDALSLKFLCNLNGNPNYDIATTMKFMIEITWHQCTKKQG